MKTGVYCLFDRVAEEAGPLFTAKSDPVAVRSARIALREANMDEHVLYQVAEYDTDRVLVEGLAKPREVRIPELMKVKEQ